MSDITQTINRERKIAEITGQINFAGWRLPYPAYTQIRLKLPVLAASTSLRRSRKAGAARMDAG
jgi:hypothetical protein